MALLLPVSSEIGFRGFPRQHSKLKTYRTQIRASISPDNSYKMSPRVKSAFEKALEYKKSKEEQKGQSKDKNGGDAVHDAFERAKEYIRQRDEKNSSKEHNAELQQGGKDPTEEDETEEVEIVAKDGGLTKMESTPSDQLLSNIKYDENKVVSSIDFIGLQVSEKNPNEGLSVRPNTRVQPTASGPLPGVEIMGVVKNNVDNEQQEEQQRKISVQKQNDRSQSILSQPTKNTGDAVRDAFERAKEYKRQRDKKNSLKEHNTGLQQGGKDPTEEDETVEVEIVAKDGLTKMESTPSDQLLSNIKYDENKVVSSIDFIGLQVSEKNPNEGLSVRPNTRVQPTASDPLPGVEITGVVKNNVDNEQQEEQQRKISVQKQNDRSQSIFSQPTKDTGDAALPAFEEASTYEHKDAKNLAMVDNTLLKEDEKNTTKEDKTVEVEIITRDGIIRRKFIPPAEAFSNIKDYRNKAISSVDFPGLRFSETKPKRGRPAGLNVDIQTPPSGSPSEVEIIVGDVTKFGYEAPARTNGSSDLYKPKVASWGVFPRPENISQTYGGGRTIRPGEPLESEEERAVREAQTKKLLEKYKKETGQNLDPEVKARCEKVLKEGNDLMDAGRLRDSLFCYEKIMSDMVFKSELHGLAALQWSVCLETLNRSNEAREMYKKLSTHPNRDVMKKAKQLLFSFEAMEKMKISQTYSLDTSGYRKYFEAFTDGYSNRFPEEEEESKDQIIGQSLPYLIFLLLPIVLVFTAAAYKRL